MPLSGGEADKLGNRYEKRWTVRKIIDILNENAIEMKIEPLGKEEEKTEFWVKYKNGKKEFHQVKRQNASNNNWTILRLKDVLKAAHDHLREDENNHFVFVSQTQCGVMREMSERAQSANSLLDFFEYFFTSDKLRKGIIKLANIWDIEIPEKFSDEENIDISAEINKNKKAYQKVYNILKRIHFRIIDTESLKEQNEALIKFLVNGEAVVGTLISFIDDNIHKEIIAADVWDYLSENGYGKNNYAGDRSVASKIETLQIQFKQSLEQKLINDSLISRLESEKLMELFDQSNDNLILLNGKAGSGKSSVLFQFVKMLEEDNIPYLPLRLDRQVPNNNSSEKFGESLNLPNSPEITISNFSGDRNSVLIIDQFDAIKWTSSNYRQAWECITGIINRGLKYNNLFIVISCRSYDLNNDPSISSWKVSNNFKELKVKKLGREIIEEELIKNNVDLIKLSANQISLLQNPLNLFLFTEVIGEKELIPFSTPVDLFDKYYELKLNEFKDLDFNYSDWADVLQQIVVKFDENQQLFINKRVISCDPEIIKALISLNVLDEYSQEEISADVISFFHQEFFDYLFAKFFIQEGKNIYDWLIENEQSLFRREQLSQLLSFKRSSVSSVRYLEIIKKLIKSKKIRFHLKQVTLHQLSQINNPSDLEADYIIDLLEEGNWKRHILPEIIYNSEDWFLALYKSGYFHNSLFEDELLSKNELINILEIYLEYYPDEIVELLDLYLDNFDWTDRFKTLISRNSITFNNEYFDWLLTAINEGHLDDYQFHINPEEENSSKLICFVGTWLERQINIVENKLEQSDQINHLDLFDNRNGINHAVFKKLAEINPGEFINTILPKIMDLIKKTVADEREIPKYDELFASNIRLRINSESMHIVNITDLLIETLETAFGKLAAENPEKFNNQFNKYKNSSYFTMQYFILKGLENCNKEFSTEAIKYIINKIKEFKQVEIKNRSGWNSSMVWIARGVIENNAAEVNDNIVQQLFDVLNGYYTANDIFSMKSRDKKLQNKSPKKWNLNINNLLFKSEYYLLSALPAEKRTKKIGRRILELKRKFGEISPPVSFESGFVGSPIEWKALEKMSNDECLSAIKKYKNLDDESNQALMGGALELSRSFEKLAHKNGKRFADLIFKFPKDSYPGYFSSVLTGITKSKYSPYNEDDSQIKAAAPASFDQLCLVIDYLYNNFEAPQILKAINRVVSENANQDWPNYILNILKENLDSNYNENERIQPEINSSRDILTEGINIVSGTAADAVGSILFQNIDKYNYFKSAVIDTLSNSNIYTKATAAKSCLAVYNFDKRESRELFNLLIEVEDKRIFATHYVKKYLNYVTIDYYEEYVHLINDLLDSTDSDVEELAASIKMRKLLKDENKEDIISFLNDANVNNIIGITRFLNDSFIRGEHLSIIKEIMVRLFNDSNPEVRREAINIFRKINNENQDKYLDIFMPVIRGKLFEDNPAMILRAMTKVNNSDFIEEEIFEVVDKITTGYDSFVDRNKFSIYGEEVIKLILSIYHNSDKDKRNKCLNAVDKLFEIRFTNAISKLDKIDRGINR